MVVVVRSAQSQRALFSPGPCSAPPRAALPSGPTTTGPSRHLLTRPITTRSGYTTRPLTIRRSFAAVLAIGVGTAASPTSRSRHGIRPERAPRRKRPAGDCRSRPRPVRPARSGGSPPRPPRQTGRRHIADGCHGRARIRSSRPPLTFRVIGRSVTTWEPLSAATPNGSSGCAEPSPPAGPRHQEFEAYA